METMKALERYQGEVEEAIRQAIPQLGEEGVLREACAYALLNGGKRFRPALVLMMADALGQGHDVMPAALGVEFLHTASLIADDLPCMDDDDERREHPSLHKVYGEPTALLASYGLIAAGYRWIAENTSSDLYPEGCVALAIKNVSDNTGLLGATGGQYLDITPPDLKKETIEKIFRMKTVALFEISYVLGWVFGGGAEAQLPLVKKAAHHFGMAFQIADDLGDREQDVANKRAVNIANLFGVDEVKKMFHVEHAAYLKVVKELGLGGTEVEGVAALLAAKI